MWTFNSDNLFSIAMVDKKTRTLVFKISGFESIEHAELFAQYAMSCLHFEYEADHTMQSKMIH